MAPERRAARRARLGAELLEAAFAGLHRSVGRLLGEGADVEAVDRSGYTALSEAAMAGHTVVVGQLLRVWADPDRPCPEDGRTALHRAAWQGWLAVLTLLLEHGADPTVKDLDGKTPRDLARGEKARQLLAGWPAEKTRRAAEERRRQLALRPPATPEDEEEEEEEQQEEPQGADAAATAVDSQTAAGACVPPGGAQPPFAPPPRRQADAADAKADREARYAEAMSKLKDELGEDAAEGGAEALSLQPPLIAFVEVQGAGEERLNGLYRATYVTKERAEYQKEDDAPCQIFWTEWQNEWRMLIGDFKLGSTLYRHTYRPNTKADECHGVPAWGWQKWFGKGPEPAVLLFPEGKPPEAQPGDGGAEEAAGPCAEEPHADAGEGEGEGARRPAEFMELHPRLEIIARDEGAPLAAGAAGGAAGGHPGPVEVSLNPGGQRLVETADGLFGADEVPATEQAPAVGPAAASADARAAEWLESLGLAPAVPAKWEAALAAKAAAQDLYAEGRVSDARQATTAAIGALRRLRQGEAEDGGKAPSEAELEALLGTMHSNRSLLLAQQIQAGEPEVLAFGPEASWRLVVSDANAALGADALNFKASFRRARALFELGDLEAALSDATRVVDHYARNSKTPNPEAVVLRDKVLEAVRKERSKWGDRGPRARWNRATNDDFITEVAAGPAERSPAAPFGAAAAAAKRAAAAQAQAASSAAAAAPARPMAAPRNGGDVEKALLSTLKDDGARAAYVRGHLPAEAVHRLFRRTPLGPDLLATVVRLAGVLAAEEGGEAAAGPLLEALASTPCARTHAEMFDAGERQALEALLRRLGPAAARQWGPQDAEAAIVEVVEE